MLRSLVGSEMCIRDSMSSPNTRNLRAFGLLIQDHPEFLRGWVSAETFFAALEAGNVKIGSPEFNKVLSGVNQFDRSSGRVNLSRFLDSVNIRSNELRLSPTFSSRGPVEREIDEAVKLPSSGDLAGAGGANMYLDRARRKFEEVVGKEGGVAVGELVKIAEWLFKSFQPHGPLSELEKADACGDLMEWADQYPAGVTEFGPFATWFIRIQQLKADAPKPKPKESSSRSPSAAEVVYRSPPRAWDRHLAPSSPAEERQPDLPMAAAPAPAPAPAPPPVMSPVLRMTPLGPAPTRLVQPPLSSMAYASPTRQVTTTQSKSSRHNGLYSDEAENLEHAVRQYQDSQYRMRAQSGAVSSEEPSQQPATHKMPYHPSWIGHSDTGVDCQAQAQARANRANLDHHMATGNRMMVDSLDQMEEAAALYSDSAKSSPENTPALGPTASLSPQDLITKIEHLM
eukprot:TRINITY_DN5483_c0_g1_i4.p1 TRINITY_DN5483_c0_g1~~TRINITY_DN5483_c0_g1_i4.p1  ORF type:complete len:473 (+),score=99.41 TRINITY_DN5483_c0_g1_i4:57-1421(+)